MSEFVDGPFAEDFQALTDAVRHGRSAEEVESIYQRMVEKIIGPSLRDPRRALVERRGENSAFRERLANRWGVALDLFELAIDHACSAGDLARDSYFALTGLEDAETKFAALTLLFGRATMTAMEVHRLLCSGLSTGAFARWRTLHEIWVVSTVLRSADDGIVGRYLAHLDVESMRADEDYELSWQALGAEPPESDPTSREARREQLREDFGSAFLSPYGWADPLCEGNATFGKLQKLAELDHWRVEYRRASHGTHANPTGIAWSVQNPLPTRQVPTGASNGGLEVPADCCLIALSNMVVLYVGNVLDIALDSEDDIDAQALLLVVQMSALRLRDEASAAFNRVAEAQMYEEEGLAQLVERATAVLRSSPSLTALEVARRLDEDDEATEEAMQRAAVRGFLTAETRFSAVPDDLET